MGGLGVEIRRSDLSAAEQAGLLSPVQGERLWAFLQGRRQDAPAFDFTHVLYYLGGLLAIGAMSLFMTLGWERFGGFGILAISLGYAALGLWLAERLRGRPGLAVPTGIMAAFVVALAPLGVYGLQQGLGLWPEGYTFSRFQHRADSSWLTMQLATLGVGVLMLWRYRTPFLVLPVASTLWYLGLELAPLLFAEAAQDWRLRAGVSLWYGLALTALAFWVDLRSRHGEDYAFWLYLFGMLAFWGGLSVLNADDEWRRFGYLCVNLLLIALGAALSRRVFAVFGALGVAGHLGHLAYRVFQDSILFPFVLTFLGLGLVGLGILWRRREGRIGGWVRARLPTALRELVTARR